MEEIKALNQQLEELGAEQEAQIEKTKEINEKLRNRIALIQSMSKVYFASFFIDVTRDTFEEIRSTQSVRNVIGTSGKAQETLYMICDKMVSPETADNLREFVKLSTIDARLRETDVITCEYVGVTSGWCQLYTLPHRIAEKTDLVTNAGVEQDPELFLGKRILLAEDNDLNAEIAIEILKEAGFMIERASDGQICVDMPKKAPAGYYDVILMDIQMPNMNGYDATRTIRALQEPGKANLPILAMTANAFEEDKREAYRSGMNGHVAKPINVRALMKELSSILG